MPISYKFRYVLLNVYMYMYHIEACNDVSKTFPGVTCHGLIVKTWYCRWIMGMLFLTEIVDMVSSHPRMGVGG
jgi:hypothetical protein